MQQSFPRLMPRPLACAIALAVAGSSMPVSVVAQETVALEEIIVTAQRRMETLQESPVAITALGENALETRGIHNTQDLIGSLPSVQGFEAPSSRGNTSIGIRGVSAGSPSNPSLDPTTAIYMDGVYIGKMMGSSLDVAEIERMEVLRGPQGTLYGRNSTGGAVNIITKKPTGEFGFKATATVGNYDLWGVKTHLDLPAIGEVGEGLGRLATSLSYYTRKRDELYGNTNPNVPGFEDLDRQAWRLALNWMPSDSVTVDYVYDHSELDELATVQKAVGMTPLDAQGTNRVDVLDGLITKWTGLGDPTGGRYLQALQSTRDVLAGIQADGEGRPSKGSAELPSTSSNDTDGHSLTVAWEVGELGFLGDVTFKSITGFRQMENRNRGDMDGIDNSGNTINDLTLVTLDQVGVAGNPVADNLWNLIDQWGGGYFRQDMKIKYEQRSQEFQMIGSTERTDYAIGLFYFEDEAEYSNDRFFSLPLAGYDRPAYDYETEALAIFSQLTYRPPILDDRLAVTVGVRYTEEDKSITYNYLNSGSPFAPGFDGQLKPVPGAPLGSKFSENFYNFSGKFNIAYQFTDDLNAYFTYSTGYRSGGFNGEVFNNPLDEETIESMELGLKSDWWDRRLRINSALFQYTYKDQQVSQIEVDANNQVTSKVANAGETERWGWELEVQVAPTEDLVLSASYVRMQGNFEEYADFCGSNGCLPTDDLAKRAQSPDNQASVMADYTIAYLPLGTLKANVSANWQDESNAAALWIGNYSGVVVPYDPVVLDERTVVNARLSLEEVKVGDGMMRFALWGKNLTDDDYANFGVNFASLGPITKQYGEPRTYGLDVTYEYY